MFFNGDVRGGGAAATGCRAAGVASVTSAAGLRDDVGGGVAGTGSPTRPDRGCVYTDTSVVALKASDSRKNKRVWGIKHKRSDR